MRDRIKLLNVDVDNITMDELVDSFNEGMLLTLHVDMIMKLQKDREFYEIVTRFDDEDLAVARHAVESRDDLGEFPILLQLHDHVDVKGQQHPLVERIDQFVRGDIVNVDIQKLDPIAHCL